MLTHYVFLSKINVLEMARVPTGLVKMLWRFGNNATEVREKQLYRLRKNATGIKKNASRF